MEDDDARLAVEIGRSGTLDFELTEEQILFREMIDRIALERHSFDNRRTVTASPVGWDLEFWRILAELGVLGAPLPEEAGGLGGGPITAMIVMQAFGRELVISRLPIR